MINYQTMVKTASVTTILPVADVKRASEFYENILGLLPKGYTPEGNYLYSCGDGVYIALSQRPEEIVDNKTSLSFEVEDLESAVAELKEKGIRLIKYPVPGAKENGYVYEMQGERAVWFKDSEGNMISMHALILN
jgi:catechol 2,3-dioxygenase-like lactoylglutathione lyase family enzyme